MGPGQEGAGPRGWMWAWMVTLGTSRLVLGLPLLLGLGLLLYYFA